MWLRSAFGTAAMACSFFALTSRAITLADATTLNQTTPLFIAILSPLLLNERGGRRVIVAVPISLTGVILLVKPPMLFGDAHAASFVPAAIALSGALMSALAMLSLRRASPVESPEAIAAHFSFTAFVVHALIALGIRAPIEARALPSMILAGVCAGLAQVAMTRSYALERAARVSPMGYLQVVVGAALSAIVLAEPLSTQGAIGIALVLVGGLVIAIAGVVEARAALKA
jgi:drug/metabolite transporter (DMT)-like permease